MHPFSWGLACLACFSLTIFTIDSALHSFLSKIVYQGRKMLKYIKYVFSCLFYVSDPPLNDGHETLNHAEPYEKVVRSK